MPYGTRILVLVALGTYGWGRVARRLKAERLKVFIFKIQARMMSGLLLYPRELER